VAEGISRCLCHCPTCARQAGRMGAGDSAAVMAACWEQGPGLRAWSCGGCRSVDDQQRCQAFGLGFPLAVVLHISWCMKLIKH